MAGLAVRLVLATAGIGCLIVGLFPRTSQHTEGSISAVSAESSRSVGTEFTLGLPSSPLYRSTTAVSDTVNTEVERQLVSQHNESSTSRVELLSWSAALVAVGAILLVAALRSRARPGEPRPQAGRTKA